VPHHLIDVRRPPDEYTVQDFVSDGRRLVCSRQEILPALNDGPLRSRRLFRGTGCRSSWAGRTTTCTRCCGTRWCVRATATRPPGCPRARTTRRPLTRRAQLTILCIHTLGSRRSTLSWPHGTTPTITDASGARSRYTKRRASRRASCLLRRAKSSSIACASCGRPWTLPSLTSGSIGAATQWSMYVGEKIIIKINKNKNKIKNGLLTELGSFHRQFPPPRDYTKGIFQAIGTAFFLK